jgi:hypothetical protein
MTANLKFKSYYFVLLPLIVVLSSLIVGQAYSPLAVPNQGGESDPSMVGLNVHLDYTFKGNDPSRVASVELTITGSGNVDVINQISVSVDGGRSWVPCGNQSGQTWVCSFGFGQEPLVSAMNNVNVVAK